MKDTCNRKIGGPGSAALAEGNTALLPSIRTSEREGRGGGPRGLEGGPVTNRRKAKIGGKTCRGGTRGAIGWLLGGTDEA